MAKATLAALKAVAKEFNKALKLDPPIVVDGKPATVAALTKDVTEVVKEVLEPSDKMTAATVKTIGVMGLELPVEKEAEEAEAEAETEEKTEEATAKKTPKDSPFVKRDFTRFTCTADVLQKAKKAIDKPTLAERSNALYAKKGGADNLKEAKWAAKVVMDVAIALEVATMDGKEITLN